MQLSSSFSGGRISCSFVRSVLADNVAEDRNLNVAAYLLLAFGNARGMHAWTFTQIMSSSVLVLLAYGPDRGMCKWTYTRIMLSSHVLFAIYSL